MTFFLLAQPSVLYVTQLSGRGCPLAFVGPERKIFERLRALHVWFQGYRVMYPLRRCNQEGGIGLSWTKRGRSDGSIRRRATASSWRMAVDEEFFVHRTDVTDEGYRSLRQGERIAFEVGEQYWRMGSQAKNVRKGRSWLGTSIIKLRRA